MSIDMIVEESSIMIGDKKFNMGVPCAAKVERISGFLHVSRFTSLLAQKAEEAGQLPSSLFTYYSINHKIEEVVWYNWKGTVVKRVRMNLPGNVYTSPKSLNFVQQVTLCPYTNVPWQKFHDLAKSINEADFEKLGAYVMPVQKERYFWRIVRPILTGTIDRARLNIILGEEYNVINPVVMDSPERLLDSSS